MVNKKQLLINGWTVILVESGKETDVSDYAIKSVLDCSDSEDNQYRYLDYNNMCNIFKN